MGLGTSIVIILLVYLIPTAIFFALYGILLWIRKKWYFPYFVKTNVAHFKTVYKQFMEDYAGEIVANTLTGQGSITKWELPKKRIYLIFRTQVFYERVFLAIINKLDKEGYEFTNMLWSRGSTYVILKHMEENI